MTFDEFDWEGLANEVEEAKKNAPSKNGDYKEVPYGDYEVKIEKIEPKTSKNGRLMMFVQFRILTGDFKKSCIFMNQIIDNRGGMGAALGFLDSLDSGVEIKTPRSSDEFNNMLLDIHEAIDNKLEYALNYGINDKGFNTFKIVEVFDV